MGKLMGTLGGRLGALRQALPQGEAALGPVLKRNVTLIDNADEAGLARKVLKLSQQLKALSAEDILAGRLER
jgi:cytochrome b pre-mRNA-processing protein 3